MIKNITGSKSNIKFCEANKDDPPRRKPDINKAINEIGWKPKIELEYGLKKCLEYYIDQIHLISARTFLSCLLHS